MPAIENDGQPGIGGASIVPAILGQARCTPHQGTAITGSHLWQTQCAVPDTSAAIWNERSYG